MREVLLVIVAGALFIYAMYDSNREEIRKSLDTIQQQTRANANKPLAENGENGQIHDEVCTGKIKC